MEDFFSGPGFNAMITILGVLFGAMVLGPIFRKPEDDDDQNSTPPSN